MIDESPIELGIRMLRYSEGFANGAYSRLGESGALKKLFPGRVDGNEFKASIDSLSEIEAADVLHVLAYGCAALKLGDAYGGSLAIAIGEGT